MENSYHDKQSWEVHNLTIDMSNSIASGDSLSAGTLSVKAFDSDATDVTSTVIHTSSVSGTDILVTVKAGTDGEDYNIRVRINTADGEQLEDDLTLRIRDKA